MKPSKSRVKRPREGRRNWLTGGKEKERVPGLPKEVEKEKTSNRTDVRPRTRDNLLSLPSAEKFHPFPFRLSSKKKKKMISKKRKIRNREKRP